MPRSILDGGEIVLLAVKPSMWRPLFQSGPWLVMCCFATALLTWLGTPLPGLSLTASAQLVLLVGLLRVALALVHWVPTWYLLTNRRIIDVHGVRRPQVSACALIHVRNTCLSVSQVERLVRLGTITFVTDHEDAPSHVWESIAEPEEVHARVRRAIENAIDHYGI